MSDSPRRGRRPSRDAASRSKHRSSRAADPARRAAYDILHEVGAEGGYSNLVSREILGAARLDARDAGFATEVAMGTLRHRGTLDAVLARCVQRPLDKLDPRVLDVLRMGAYQLLYLRTASHAAVSSSVDLVDSVAGAGPKGLVNAVLRKVASHPLEWWVDKLQLDVSDKVGRLAVANSHPRWIVSALRDALGGDDAQLAELLSCNNTPPGVTLVARPGASSVEELLLEPDTAPGAYSPFAVRLLHGAPGRVAAVRQRRAGVQDEGSQLVAVALAEAPLEGRDRLWLDMCAGPGGKAALLAGLARRRGAALLAVEPRAVRARLVAQSLSSEGVEQSDAVVVQADGRHGPWRPGSFDRVLVDAPCTGLGVLRRRPEARWRRQPSDVSALVELQRELLLAALDAVRPGGLVAYVTCSPHVAETDLVVDDVLSSRPDVHERDAREGLPGSIDWGEGPRLRLWPHQHGTDGMFCALLTRSGESGN